MWPQWPQFSKSYIVLFPDSCKARNIFNSSVKRQFLLHQRFPAWFGAAWGNSGKNFKQTGGRASDIILILLTTFNVLSQELLGASLSALGCVGNTLSIPTRLTQQLGQWACTKYTRSNYDPLEVPLQHQFWTCPFSFSHVTCYSVIQDYLLS